MSTFQGRGVPGKGRGQRRALLTTEPRSHGAREAQNTPSSFLQEVQSPRPGARCASANCNSQLVVTFHVILVAVTLLASKQGIVSTMGVKACFAWCLGFRVRRDCKQCVCDTQSRDFERWPSLSNSPNGASNDNKNRNAFRFDCAALTLKMPCSNGPLD